MTQSRNIRRNLRLDIIQFLFQCPDCSAAEICTSIKSAKGWTLIKLKELYEEKRIYISDWRRRRKVGPYAPCYSLGSAEDEPVPKPLGNLRNKYYRRRIAQMKKSRPEERLNPCQLVE